MYTKTKNARYVYAAIMLLCCSCTSTPFFSPDENILTEEVGTPEEACPPGIISFQSEIKPLLISNCAYSGCHDAISREDGVVLDSYANIRREVKANDPRDSELYKSITETDQDDIMPPPPQAPLNKDQIALIREWINQGAENTNCGIPCNPLEASFIQNIMPLVENLCLGCHNNASVQGNVNLSTYSHIKTYVQNGSFLGSIRHEAGYSKMPPSGNPVDDCHIAQIEKWIAEGGENN